jgi:hypothetical protein
VEAMMRIVKQYGSMWARNSENIKKIPRARRGGQGVYVLFDGSMPVYVGKGNIHARIRRHRSSKRIGQRWDRFSWYILADKKMMHDTEVLMLKVLPTYLRALTRQGGGFLRADRTVQENKVAEYISRKP